jgi:hypothetical protein
LISSAGQPPPPAQLDAGDGAAEAGDAPADRRDDAGDGDPFAAACDRYCTSVMNRCIGGSAGYESRDQCLYMCAQLPAVGIYGEVADSIGCRALQAETAGPHCTLASAFGGDFCGSRCGAFCELTVALCNKGAGNVQPFDDFPSCLPVCQCDAGPGCYDFDKSAPEYSPNDRGRLNCLEHYLRKAYASPAATSEPDAAGSDRDNCPVLLLADGGPCTW